MAKSSAYRWQNERKRGLFKDGPLRNNQRPDRRRPAKITNKQAQFLASLQRDLGVNYTGRGMTKGEATKAIDQCLRKLGRKAKTLPKRGRHQPLPESGDA